MLLGCGCNCDTPPGASVPSLSVIAPSSLTSSESTPSISQPPSACGACYNYPARWSVNLLSGWFELSAWALSQPNRFYDCKNVFGGNYTLRSYSATQMTLAARSYLALGLGQDLNNVCGVWHSDKMATYTERFNPDGTPSQVCRNNGILHPAMEIVSLKSKSGNYDYAGIFYVFWYYAKRGNYRDEFVDGWVWSWDIAQEQPISCVRIFYADFIRYYLNTVFPVYVPSQINQGWQTIQISPA